MSEQNIRIKLTADSELEPAIQDLQQLQDREKDIRMEMLKTQSEYQKQVASIQTTVKGREAQISAIDKLQKKHTEYQRSLENEQKKIKTSMHQYNDALKNVNDTVAKGAVSTPKLTTQIRALKDELARMEQDGISPSSKGFVDLAVKTARLEDQMGDTQKRIRVLASDTKELDAAMSIGQGLAGGFTAATSAAALLGGESEELQKAFFKVQAVMSILNGVNQVAIALNKDSAARVVIGTAATNMNTFSKVKNYAATKIQAANTAIESAVTGKGTIAKGAATAAQWALNAAMYAFPLVAIIAGLAALTAGIVMFAKNTGNAKKAQELMNSELEISSIRMAQLKKDSDVQIELMRAMGATDSEVINQRRKANDAAIQEAERTLKKIEENIGSTKSWWNKIWNTLPQTTKDAIQKANDALKSAYDEQNQINQDATVLDLQTKTATEKAKTDAQIKAQEERIKAQEFADNQYIKQEAEFYKQLEAVEKKRLADYLKNAEQKKQWDANLRNAGMDEEEAYVVDYITLQNRKREQGLISDVDFYNLKLDYLSKYTTDEKAIEQANYEYTKALRDKALEDEEARQERLMELLMASADIAKQIYSAVYEFKRSQIEQELDDLSRMYTTDARMAKENKDLKLISEKELARKQLEIKQRMAKADKQQAIFTIAIDTLVAGIAALKTDPTGITSAIISLKGLVAGIAAGTKPLPKYAKGKKAGGGGHFATVGEQGAETIWIPDNSAIIPHGRSLDFKTFSEFGIPSIPDLGDRYIRDSGIDYKKLGRAVADNVKIPTPKPVTVNVDKSGITTFDGILTVKHLNKKYTGEWN